MSLNFLYFDLREILEINKIFDRKTIINNHAHHDHFEKLISNFDVYYNSSEFLIFWIFDTDCWKEKDKEKEEEKPNKDKDKKKQRADPPPDPPDDPSDDDDYYDDDPYANMEFTDEEWYEIDLEEFFPYSNWHFFEQIVLLSETQTLRIIAMI